MGPVSTFSRCSLLLFVQPKSRDYDLDITSGKVSVGGDSSPPFRLHPDPTSRDTFLMC